MTEIFGLKNIYEELHKLNATLHMHWISTNYQLADESSRFINWNEEYFPKILYDKILNELNVRCDIDVFASKANKKCEQWINFGPTNMPNCVGFDFFCMNPMKLKGQILYAFPPKNILNKAISHLTQFYKSHKVVLMFHIFNEWPAATPKLVQLGAEFHKIGQGVTIVPAEFQLKFEGQMHYGFWNEKPKQTVIATWNI